jgi:transcriptional regulator with XRE-family HTH domain
MEYQTIKENGKVKLVVLPVKSFQAMLDRIEDESDLRDIREAKSELVYDQNEAEAYIFMNPVKRERIERGWIQEELARRIGVKQATVAKWEREGALYRRSTTQKLAKVFAISETTFSLHFYRKQPWAGIGEFRRQTRRCPEEQLSLVLLNLPAPREDLDTGGLLRALTKTGLAFAPCPWPNKDVF